MSRTIQQFGQILLSQAATSTRREKRSYSRMPGGCIDFRNLEWGRSVWWLRTFGFRIAAHRGEPFTGKCWQSFFRRMWKYKTCDLLCFNQNYVQRQTSWQRNNTE